MAKKNLDAEEQFLTAWNEFGFPGSDITKEFRFHPQRRWRFDWCFPSKKVAIEIEGRGRHQTVVGYRRDCEKYNCAAELGWTVLRFPATDMRAKDPTGDSYLENFIEQVCRVLCLRSTYEQAGVDTQVEELSKVPSPREG